MFFIHRFTFAERTAFRARPRQRTRRRVRRGIPIRIPFGAEYSSTRRASVFTVLVLPSTRTRRRDGPTLFYDHGQGLRTTDPTSAEVSVFHAAKKRRRRLVSGTGSRDGRTDSVLAIRRF